MVSVEIDLCAAGTRANLESDEAIFHFALFKGTAGVVEPAGYRPIIEIAKPDGFTSKRAGLKVHVLRTGPLAFELERNDKDLSIRVHGGAVERQAAHRHVIRPHEQEQIEPATLITETGRHTVPGRAARLQK